MDKTKLLTKAMARYRQSMVEVLQCDDKFKREQLQAEVDTRAAVCMRLGSTEKQLKVESAMAWQEVQKADAIQ